MIIIIIIIIRRRRILKNLTQKKKLNISLLFGQCLQDVNLIKKKENLVIIEEKIVLKVM